jgi:hypothetical protein
MHKKRLSIATLLAASVIILSSCGAGKNDPGVEYAPNMYHPVSYEPLKQITDVTSGKWVNSQVDSEVGEYYSSNPNNPFRMTMREPVPNTIRRGDFIPYRIPKDSFALAERVLMNPLDSTESVVSDGKLLYTRFCGHCHGADGLVAGKVGEVYAGVPSYASAAIKDKKEGHIYQVITYGKGRMLGHASQLSVEERWKIVRYVQILQKQ